MSMIATNLRQLICCAARWAQIIPTEGLLPVGNEEPEL
jgi:hypothetical protein